MRQIVLDTETTGLDHKQGDRIIEIAGVELMGRRLTGRHFHVYIQPDREISAGAMNVHGITNEFLLDKPRFPEIAAEFIEFIREAELVIHNAAFDVGFLNAEFGLMRLPPVADVAVGVVDTLRMAREMHPGRKNSLDALCDRYEIDNAHRTLHGALLDAELLAEVYLAMTRGQESLVMDLEDNSPSAALQAFTTANVRLRVQRASDAEQARHAALLAAIDKESKGRCLWLMPPEGQA